MNNTKPTEGFALVEGILGLAILGILGFGLYLLLANSFPSPFAPMVITETPTPSPQSNQPEANTEELDIEEINKNNQTLETNTPLPTDSTDATVNGITDDLNTLDSQINSLDELETDLQLPSINLSTE